MTVQLADRLQDFYDELNPPGQTVVTMSDDEGLRRLINAFWEMRLMGLDFLESFTCDDGGNITPQAGSSASTTYGYVIPAWYTDGGGTDLGREIQVAIILFAAYRAVLASYTNLKSSVSYKAGSVSYEVQQSAQVLQASLKMITARIDIVLTRLSDVGSTTVAILDSVIDSTCAMWEGDAWWVR